MKGLSRLSIVLASAFTLVLIIALSSCSSRRIRQSQRLNNRSETRLMSTDSLHLQWIAGRQRLQLSAQDQQVWIWPTGEFRFRPDSGFIGSASALRIQNASQSIQQIEESVLARAGRIQSLDSSETTNLWIHNRQSETQRTHLLPSRWWLYAGVLVALVVFYLWLRRKFC